MKTAKEIAEKIYNDEYYAGKAEQAIKDYARQACKEQMDLYWNRCLDVGYTIHPDDSPKPELK